MRPSRRALLLLSIALVLTVVPATGWAASAVPPVETATIDGVATTSTATTDGRVVSLSEPRPAPLDFSMVGFEVPTGVTVEFRTAKDGAWGPWTAAEVQPEDEAPDAAEGAAATDGAFTTPVWVDDADEIQLRITGGRPEDVTVHVIDSAGRSQPWYGWVLGAFAGWHLVTPTAQAADRPAIVSRSAWGADESIRRADPEYATPRLGFVHHTAGSNSYSREEAPAVVRGIYAYHVQARGWNDIGYNFLVDRYGTIYEGRYGGMDKGVVGAHVRGYNYGSFGVSVMGNFDTAPVPQASLDALARLIAWKYQVHGIDGRHPDRRIELSGRSLLPLNGHRDAGTTSCPGANLYAALPGLRQQVAALSPALPVDGGTAPLPAPLPSPDPTPTVTSSPTPAPSPSPSPTQQLPPPPPAVGTSMRYYDFAPTSMSAYTPIAGDWDGDGMSTPGWFRDGQWWLAQGNEANARIWSFSYGRAGDRPVVGDWNGDGHDTVGIVRGNAWYLRDTNGSGATDHRLSFGRATDTPLAGDWNGDGQDGPAVKRGNVYYFDDALDGGAGTGHLAYGRASDTPVVGDWNGDGHDTFGVVRDITWYLDNALDGGTGDVRLAFGRPSDTPVVADWNGDHRTSPAIVRGNEWFLDDDADGGGATSHFRLGRTW